jgi:hypothetical protein
MKERIIPACISGKSDEKLSCSINFFMGEPIRTVGASEEAVRASYEMLDVQYSIFQQMIYSMYDAEVYGVFDNY